MRRPPTRALTWPAVAAGAAGACAVVGAARSARAARVVRASSWRSVGRIGPPRERYGKTERSAWSGAGGDHHLDAAVLRSPRRVVAAVGLGVGRHRVRFAVTHRRRAGGEVFVGGQPVAHRAGAALGELLVVVVAALGVGVTLDGDGALLLRELRAERGEGGFGLRGERGLVEGEERVGGHHQPVTALLLDALDLARRLPVPLGLPRRLAGFGVLSSRGRYEAGEQQHGDGGDGAKAARTA